MLFCIYLCSLIRAKSLGTENGLGLCPSRVFDVRLLMRLAAESRLAPNLSFYADVMLQPF